MYVHPAATNVQIPSLTISDFLTHLNEKRYVPYGYGYGYGYSGWSGYGRWILLGVLVGAVVLIWALLCCCNRRRTRRGQSAVPYTGWATPGVARPQQMGVTNAQPYQPQGYPQQNMGYAPQGGQYVPQGGYNQYQPGPPQYGQQTQYPAPTAGREK